MNWITAVAAAVALAIGILVGWLFASPAEVAPDSPEAEIERLTLENKRLKEQLDDLSGFIQQGMQNMPGG